MRLMLLLLLLVNINSRIKVRAVIAMMMVMRKCITNTIMRVAMMTKRLTMITSHHNVLVCAVVVVNTSCGCGCSCSIDWGSGCDGVRRLSVAAFGLENHVDV